MTNTIDGEPTKCSSPTPSSSDSSSVPPSCSRCTVTSLRWLGWTGTPQLTCSVCGEKTTTACAQCSKADQVVALCKPERNFKGKTIFTHRLRVHQKEPEAQRKAIPKKVSIERAKAHGAPGRR